MPGTTVTASTTILSAWANGFTADVAATFNEAWPVSLGGTGTTDLAFPDGTIRIKNTADGTKKLAFDLSALTTATTRTVAFPDKSGTAAFTSDLGANATPTNLTLIASVSANALTIAVKGHDGNDPSATNVVYVPFRSATAGSGDIDVLSLTAATSLVISSGSTMGFTSAVAGRLWIVGFNDGGTFRLGAVNCLSGVNIMPLRNGIYSSTAEGGAGGADSAQVIYTGTAVTSKALTILGYLEATEATAGTWATTPSVVKAFQPGDALPGDTIQSARTDTGAVATGSTSIPYDDTTPQNTEGDQYMTQAITPKSGANLLDVFLGAEFGNSGTTNATVMALFVDSVSSALKVSTVTNPALNNTSQTVLYHRAQAVTTSATTFKLRAGTNNGATLTFNGAAAGRLFGGTVNSFMQISEIMA